MSALDPTARYLYAVDGTPVLLPPNVVVRDGTLVVLPLAPPKPGENVPT